jgi:flagellar biosynthesis component FlhA
MTLQFGVLYYESEKTGDLLARLTKCCQEYTDKYGAFPNTVHVPENSVCEESTLNIRISGADIPILVIKDRMIITGHLWIGYSRPVDAELEFPLSRNEQTF